MKSILTSAINQLASLHDLPELLQAEIVDHEGSLKVTATVTPRGQLSAIVQSLEVEAILFPNKIKNVFSLRLNFSYQHIGGGSNGKSVDYIIATETGRNGDHEFVGMTESSVFRRLFGAFENRD